MNRFSDRGPGMRRYGISPSVFGRFSWPVLVLIVASGCYRAGKGADDADSGDSEDTEHGPFDSALESLDADSNTDLPPIEDTDSSPQRNTDRDTGGDTSLDGDTDGNSSPQGERDSESDSDTETSLHRDTASSPHETGDSDTDINTDSSPQRDSDSDVDTSFQGDTDSDTGTECTCDAPFVCGDNAGDCICPEGYTGNHCDTCDADAGFVELPSEPGRCIPDPCSGVSCGEARTCVVGDDGAARCVCDNGLKGLACNELWHAIQIPPAVVDMALDSAGNGWFVTTEGLLYWDFNTTPGDGSDDAWQLFREFSTGGASDPYSLTYLRSISVDGEDRKWMTNGEYIYRLDDNGTPSDAEDDNWTLHDATSINDGIIGYFDSIRRIHADPENRIWCIPYYYDRVAVLPDGSLPEEDGLPHIDLLQDVNIRDILPVEGGAWIAATDGLFYVDFGESLSDESDDKRIEFSDNAVFAGRMVNTIEQDVVSGLIWFNTDRGIVTLAGGGDPFDEANHVWTEWSPVDGGAVRDIGPVLGIGPDQAVWLLAPSGEVFRVEDANSGDDTLTTYSPRQCPRLENIDSESGVRAIAVDGAGRMWVHHWNRLLLFDDRDTPTDLADDLWIDAGVPRAGGTVSQFYPAEDGGLWIHIHDSIPGSRAGRNDLYSFEIGHLENRFDDTWYEWNFGESGPAGFEFFVGPDARENLWFTTSGLSIRTTYHGLDFAGTPRDPDDDGWVTWTGDDADFFNTGTAAIDPEDGLWIGGFLYRYGDSLTDIDAASWWQIDPYSPNQMAVDETGGRWFGYNTSGDDNPEIPGPLRYLDDNGTPEIADDDIWIDFTSEDGLPFEDVRHLAIDNQENKWIAGHAEASGATTPSLCSLNHHDTPTDKSDDTWTCYAAAEALLDSDIEAMSIDENTDVWLGSDHDFFYLHIVP